MRIAHVANFYGPRSGGLRTTMRALAEGYSQRGIDVLHIVPGEATVHSPTMSVLRAPRIPRSGGYRMIVSVRQVIDQLEQFSPDVLEVSDRFTLVSLAEWARKNDVYSALFVHETLSGLATVFVPAGHVLRPVIDRWNAHTATKFDRVIATTEFAAREIRDVGASNLRKIGLGVDLATFNPRWYDNALRSRLAIGADTLLVHCGRLSPEKRVERSIDTVAELCRRGVSARLVVIGDGPQRARLEERAAGLPVDFLGFIHDRGDLARHLAVADVSLAPGPFETFCLAALESLACGTPIVASRSSAVGEIIDGESAAGSVADNTAASFANEVVRLTEIDEPQRRGTARRLAERSPWTRTIETLLADYASRTRVEEIA